MDAQESGGSRTGSAVALARLLRLECGRLLELWKERETGFADHTPDGGRMVSLKSSSSSSSSTTEEEGGEEEEGAETKVQRMHGALRQCLGLLHCVMEREEEEWGELEGDYALLRNTVRRRLELLLHATKALVETEAAPLDVTPDHRCSEEVDGGGGAFGLKLWTLRVLLELVHWADHATHTLHALHRERGGSEDI